MSQGRSLVSEMDGRAIKGWALEMRVGKESKAVAIVRCKGDATTAVEVEFSGYGKLSKSREHCDSPCGVREGSCMPWL